MQVEEYEEIIETEEEHLSIHLFGTNYSRLSPELREWVRGRAITILWTEYVEHGPVAAA
jgi:hypothetical protein